MKTYIAILTVLSLGMVSCASMDNQQRGAAAGAAIGAGSGAIIGNQYGPRGAAKGALIGAAAGGALGLLYGQNEDKIATQKNRNDSYYSPRQRPVGYDRRDNGLSDPYTAPSPSSCSGVWAWNPSAGSWLCN